MVSLRRFLKYVTPSVLAFALSGIYCIVDGFFVGNSVGDNGLTVVNIAYPMVALSQAVGTGIGMGKVYLTILTLGSVSQIFGTGVVPLIRNHGGAAFAMIIMSAGFVVNIILDYVLVWKLETGLAGAAVATLIGQSVTSAGGIIYLLIILMGFLFLAVSRVATSYFYATQRSVRAMVVIYSEVVLLFLLLLILTPLLGDQIIWWCMTIAQFLSAVLAVFLIKKNRSVKKIMYK